MITETRKCDGCGEKIEPSNQDILPNITTERRAELLRSASMFLSVGIHLNGQTIDAEGVLNAERHGSGHFDVCMRCAETRTIASFRLKNPAA